MVVHSFSLGKPSGGGLHEDIGIKETRSSSHSCIYLSVYLLELTSSGSQFMQKARSKNSPSKNEQLLGFWTLHSQLPIVGLVGLQTISH